MDMHTFQRLCRERASGRKTELEFWNAMMKSFETHQPGSPRGARDKEMLLRRFKKHIACIQAREDHERHHLAKEVESWLRAPETSA